MDPDETLAFIRRHVASLLDSDLTHEELSVIALDLAEATRDLDNWCSRGGFLPAEWQAKRSV